MTLDPKQQKTFVLLSSRPRGARLVEEPLRLDTGQPPRAVLAEAKDQLQILEARLAQVQLYTSKTSHETDIHNAV